MGESGYFRDEGEVRTFDLTPNFSLFTASGVRSIPGKKQQKILQYCSSANFCLLDEDQPVARWPTCSCFQRTNAKKASKPILPVATVRTAHGNGLMPSALAFGISR